MKCYLLGLFFVVCRVFAMHVCYKDYAYIHVYAIACIILIICVMHSILTYNL